MNFFEGFSHKVNTLGGASMTVFLVRDKEPDDGCGEQFVCGARISALRIALLTHKAV